MIFELIVENEIESMIEKEDKFIRTCLLFPGRAIRLSDFIGFSKDPIRSCDDVFIWGGYCF